MNRTDLRPALIAMVATTVALAGLVLAASGPIGLTRPLWFWLIVCTVSELLWVRLPLGRATLSMSSCFNLATLLVLPRGEAMLAVAFSIAIAESAFMRKHPVRVIFNSAQTALAVAAGSLAFTWLGGSGERLGPLIADLDLLPFGAAALAYTAVNTGAVSIGVVMLWTLLTSCGVAAAFAWRPLRRVLAERRVEGMMLLFYLAGMTAFALVVHLTEDNEHKFAFQVFVPLAVIGGAGFLPAVRGWFRRWGGARASLLLVALFLSPLIMLNGYLFDPRWRTAPELGRAPGEERLYAWMRDSTDARAVFVDARHRDFIMVRGQRRLYYGSTFGPERAGFPLPQVIERRAVMDDLFGPGADLGGDARALRVLRAPAFIVFRPEDEAAGHPAPWHGLERHADWFGLAYERDGFRVYGVKQAVPE